MERTLIIVAILLATPLVWGQATPEPKSTKKALKASASKSKKKLPKKKYRTGSYLIRNKPVKVEFDGRGDFERRRDFEITLHFNRMAELDVIEALAAKSGESSIGDRVERIRRIEKARYRSILGKLKLASQYKSSVGTK